MELWDLAARHVLWDAYRDYTEVRAVAWRPDGKVVAGTTWQGVHLWDARTGRKLQVLEGTGPESPHRVSDLFSLSWSPNGKRLAGGGRGGSLAIWDLPLASGGRTRSRR